MGKVLEYCKLTLTDLQALRKDKSLFLMQVSPIEVHGPHLPLGTDVYVSGELMNRYMTAISGKYPDLDLVVMPPLFAGSSPLPVKGSIAVPATTLESLLFAFVKGLADQGFRYLLLADNHGGPAHQMAIEAAARKAWRKYRFYLIDPFNADFRKMVECDPEFLNGTGLARGTCGDDTDSHAGTNETSLMLVTAPEMIKENYRGLPASVPPQTTGAAKVVVVLSGIVGSAGGKRFSGDLKHLANTLAWISQPDMTPYMGDPKKATRAAGEAMLEARVKVAMELVDGALAGKEVQIVPLLWQIKALRRFF